MPFVVWIKDIVFTGERKMGWVNVNDRLPECNGTVYSNRVLILDANGVQKISEYSHELNHWSGTRTVTHWMPLPSNQVDVNEPLQPLSQNLIDCLRVAADAACDDGEYVIERWLRVFGAFDPNLLGVMKVPDWEKDNPNVLNTVLGWFQVFNPDEIDESHTWEFEPRGWTGLDNEFHECHSMEDGRRQAEKHYLKLMAKLVATDPSEVNLQTSPVSRP